MINNFVAFNFTGLCSILISRKPLTFRCNRDKTERTHTSLGCTNFSIWTLSDVETYEVWGCDTERACRSQIQRVTLIENISCLELSRHAQAFHAIKRLWSGLLRQKGHAVRRCNCPPCQVICRWQASLHPSSAWVIFHIRLFVYPLYDSSDH